MYWFWIIGWVPTSLAIIGNGLVIYLITTRRRLNTIPNWFVLSLAVADFSVGSFAFPSRFICEFAPFRCNVTIRDDVSVLVIFASVANLCFMTFDRYVAIVMPLRYTNIMTERRALLLITFAWVTPLVAFFIPALCSSFGGFDINTEVSIIVWTSLFEFLPCVGLLLATAKITRTAKRHCQRTTRLDSQLRYNNPSHLGQRVVSSARVIKTVVAIFLVCYILEVYSSLCFFTKLCKRSKDLEEVVYLLVVTNSAGNPVAYALFKRDIRRELMGFLFKRRQLNAR